MLYFNRLVGGLEGPAVRPMPWACSSSTRRRSSGGRCYAPRVYGTALSYLALVLASLAGIGFVAVVFARFGREGWKILLGILVASALVGGAGEAMGQLWARSHPAYQVLFLAPHRWTGWTQVPHLRFVWTGSAEIAPEFSVRVAANAHGFRDRERSLAKSAGVERVALLGDSMVEALQVPFERTAGQLLERELDAASGSAGASRPRWEVLNFGISNYGLGQYLLAWEHFARHFSPQLVFAYLAEFQMLRTDAGLEASGFDHERYGRLWVRPTFRLEGERLIREPARDYARFVAVREEIDRREFGGKSIRTRPVGWILPRVPAFLAGRLALLGGRRDRLPQADEETVRLSLRVLEELATRVRSAGARLVVVDAIRYHEGTATLSERVRTLCAEEAIGYLDLSLDLLAANEKGIATHWRRDLHFNEAGNRIFADAMARWIRTETTASAPTRGG